MLFKKKNASIRSGEPDYESILDQKLYNVPETGEEITWADAVEGTLILGATSSDKTSGPSKHAALAMLQSGWGFCIFCVKTYEKDRWIKYADQTSRLDDVVVFNEERGLKFNFLTFELTCKGKGAGETLNVKKTIMSLAEQLKIYQSGGGGQGKDEAFWYQSLERIIDRSIDLLLLTKEEVSISNMRAVVSSCLKEDEPTIYFDLKETSTMSREIDPKKRETARERLNIWIKSSYCLHLFEICNVELPINRICNPTDVKLNTLAPVFNSCLQ